MVFVDRRNMSTSYRFHPMCSHLNTITIIQCWCPTLSPLKPLLRKQRVNPGEFLALCRQGFRLCVDKDTTFTRALIISRELFRYASAFIPFFRDAHSSGAAQWRSTVVSDVRNSKTLIVRFTCKLSHYLLSNCIILLYILVSPHPTAGHVQPSVHTI